MFDVSCGHALANCDYVLSLAPHLAINKVFPENFSADEFGSVPHHHIKWPAMGHKHTQHDVTCENALWELSWLFTATEFGESKIVCLYIIFDKHTQVFTMAHGATWHLAIAKSTCKVHITIMLPFIMGCHNYCGSLHSLIGFFFFRN
jgi:hypothetical protein